MRTRLIKLAKNLSLSSDIVTQTIGILAIKGGGKTYAAGKIVEGMLNIGAQVAVIDPVGNWYGLRLGKTSARKGYDIPIFGGLHGDVPLERGGGRLMAKVLVEHRTSAVLDVSQFRKADRKQFVTDFAEELFHLQKKDVHPIHIILEEAQMFVPERVGKDEARMVGAFEDIVRLGRNYGIGVTLISQRPQSVNKNVLNQVECLIVGRLVAAHERKAISNWIRHQGVDIEELVDSLPSMKTEEKWIWSPSWLEIFKKVIIEPKVTLDSSSTPKIGKKRRSNRRLRKIDLRRIKEDMSNTIERVEETNPLKLKQIIVALERQLQRPNTEVKFKEKVKRVEIFVLKDKHLRKLKRLISDLTKALKPISDGLALLDKQSKLTVAPKITQAQPRRNDAVPISSGDVKLRPGEIRILQSVTSYHPVKLTKAQIGTLSGFTSSGGTFSNYFGTLKKHELLVGLNGSFWTSEKGFNVLGQNIPAVPMTVEGVQEMWRRALNSGQRKMVDSLLAVHPNGLTREELGEKSGYMHTAGTFGNYLGVLRRNDLARLEDRLLYAGEALFRLS